ncbi:hypothetical protein SZ54_3094 [Rhizobium sp. UR51a]|uniref:Uncharacterized protein n=1 Tax=Agrobacterium genomosp. 2 str. CFBP 5494 TaxID=1183436 RepID=A0A9W5B060_9HYPH|nr:hypothetical protein SZ54_3094 [Rhizobium sp. UR51a]CUW90317.1 hypothetical protein AGR2A_Cc180025 [Agrobacterium genomosp. 2 str. CFBP 5494]
MGPVFLNALFSTRSTAGTSSLRMGRTPVELCGAGHRVN